MSDLVRTYRVQADQGKRLFPCMKVHTGRLGPTMPPEFRREFSCGVLIRRSDNQKRLGRIQTISGELAGEHPAHLLKLASHMAPSSVTSIRNHAEVGAANLTPWLVPGES